MGVKLCRIMNSVYLLLLLAASFTGSSGDPGGSEPRAPSHPGHGHQQSDHHHGASEQHRTDKSLSAHPAHEAIQYKSWFNYPIITVITELQCT